MTEFGMETQVAVRDLPVMADIGINMHEIGARQPLVIDVCLTVPPVTEDTLPHTVDYRRIAALAEALSARRIGLIETFGTELARSCLAMDHVRRVVVTVRKPRALEAGMASVTIAMAKPGDERAG